MLLSVVYLCNLIKRHTLHTYKHICRSFIGSTVHWIDPTDLSRKMATLAIKEIKVSQI